MASEPDLRDGVTRLKRIPLGGSRRRLSFERRLRLWLYLMGIPALVLCAVLARRESWTVIAVLLLCVAAGWAFLVSLVMEQIVRPLQTLANVISALREDDYSFRARGARREDAIGDLAIEVNTLAAMLQGQRSRSIEAMALVERVLSVMQAPVLAFDMDGRLRLVNTAAERLFSLSSRTAIGRHAEELALQPLLTATEEHPISVDRSATGMRWVVKRTSFRLRGLPHTLLVLADVSSALREEERQAWRRLIRVMGHEINNSLTPIKSIAGTLRLRVQRMEDAKAHADMERGLAVIEDRSESLNRFLQAYRQLSGMPAPRLQMTELGPLVQRVIQLETRLSVVLVDGPPVTVMLDADQVPHALINLVKNAAEAAMDAGSGKRSLNVDPHVQVGWSAENGYVSIKIVDNGDGIMNAGNIFVPFYTTKPEGTGIGLALALQIAEGHGGTVRLQNREDGGGCEAELRLPLR